MSEEGFLVDEKTITLFPSYVSHGILDTCNFENLEYTTLFKNYAPDMIILFGNSCDSYKAGIEASQMNIPIVHIQGGESDYRVWDDAYGYGITKLSSLHFTSTEKYRQQVIQFGENDQSVFNVGSLLVERINGLATQRSHQFYETIGLNEGEDYLFISYEPDATLGSRNAAVFNELLETLKDKDLYKFKFVFNRSENVGLEKMINQMIDSFVDQHKGRAVSVPKMNLSDLGMAIKYSSATLTNASDCNTIAPTFGIPLISIGKKLQDKTKAKNCVEGSITSNEIRCAVQNGLSTQFQICIEGLASPFEKPSPSNTIMEMIKGYLKIGSKIS